MKYHVEKNIKIKADVSKVRSLVEDFKQWNSWSPWTIVEPDCKMDISGNAGAVGHMMIWNGEIIGSGKNTLVQNDGGGLRYDLEFIKPFKSKAKTSFVFEKSGEETSVTWTMDSSMPFFLFFMVNKMKNWIGMDYERGLRMLKAMAEKGKVDATTVNNGIVDMEGFSYVGIQKTVPFEDVGVEMKKDFGKLMEDVVNAKGKSAKRWISLYPKMDMANMQMTYIAAMSDEELGGVSLGLGYVRGKVESGKALEIKHDGAYDFLGNAWSMGMMFVRVKKMKQSGIPFEQYWNSPKEVEPHELKTSVYFPLKG